jgi:predicted DsbA family dithiol-disulfide isomerase
MSQHLRIDAFFDFICPWCLIGKRQLDRALEQLQRSHPDVDVTLVWHGVQLLPDLPVQGEAFAEFYLKRLGSADAVRMRQAQVQQAAAAAGVNIDLQRIGKMPNTANAHRLFECATAQGTSSQRDALLERLFAAYFQKGEDLGDSATLLAIAESCGWQTAALSSLRSDGSPFVGGHAPSGGVPYFVFDHRLAVSGAQPAEVLLGAMHKALAHSAAVSQSA